MDRSQVELAATSYGKTGVKLLYIERDSASDEITEYEGEKVTRGYLVLAKAYLDLIRLGDLSRLSGQT